MLAALKEWWRRRERGPMVRPWGLVAPILVLIVCLPLLRPWRQGEMSENEASRLATVRAIVEKHTLAMDGAEVYPTQGQITTAKRGGERHYSPQPPVMAALLAGPYWLMHKMGLTFESNLALAVYLLTLIGVTLPVAAAAGVGYPRGRG